MRSPRDEAAAIAGEVARDRLTLTKRIEALMMPHRLFRRLFCDANGVLTDDAVAWFDLIGRECFAGRSTFDANERVHAYRQGASDHFNLQLGFGRLDERRLAGLVRQRKELGDE